MEAAIAWAVGIIALILAGPFLYFLYRLYQDHYHRHHVLRNPTPWEYDA